MEGTRLPSLDREMLIRRCVACGYAGGLLQAGLADRCARCGVDLRERPAMSYAEMEGLIGQAVDVRPVAEEVDAEAAPTGVALEPYREQHIIQRWLAFLFIAMLGLIAFVYLAAAAIPV